MCRLAFCGTFVYTFKTSNRNETFVFSVYGYRINILTHACVAYPEKFTRTVFTFFKNLILLFNANIPIFRHCFNITAIRVKVKIIPYKLRHCGEWPVKCNGKIVCCNQKVNISADIFQSYFQNNHFLHEFIKIIRKMRRTLKDSFRKVRALRARELREVTTSLFFLAFLYLYISVHSTIEPSLSTIIVET